MQVLSVSPVYDACMARASHLRALRELSGLSQRKLAREIKEDHSNVRYWENSGTLPRSDVLIKMAKALGVTVEELLGEPKPAKLPAGKLGDLFKAIAELPPDERQQVLEVVEPYVEKKKLAKQQSNGQRKAA